MSGRKDSQENVVLNEYITWNDIWESYIKANDQSLFVKWGA